jgi:hypothetical protein
MCSKTGHARSGSWEPTSARVASVVPWAMGKVKSGFEVSFRVERRGLFALRNWPRRVAV